MDDEQDDPVWDLLSRAGRTLPRSGFSSQLARLAQQEQQERQRPEEASEPAPREGFFALFGSAPAAWRAAAAAIVVFSACVAVFGLSSGPRGSGPATPGSGIPVATSASAVPSGVTGRSAVSELLPIEEALATEELEMLLQIEDSQSLNDADLLLLLVPDWELL